MTFYIKEDADGVVVDAVTYAFKDYLPMELPMPLPDCFLGGWYKRVGDEYVFDQELYDLRHVDPEPYMPEPYDETADLLEAAAIMGLEPEEGS